ncbi:MAG: histone deacetylase [Bryobacteraceae bacterium]
MTALLAGEIYGRHNSGPGHPERPERLDALIAGLDQSHLRERLAPVPPRPATPDEILLCHTPGYLKSVERDVKAGYGTLSTGDTDFGPESLNVAFMAAGGVLKAVDQVMQGRVRNAFCAVRPPGHHATPNRGMGFCFFNNVAIAARYAQKRHAVERVLIADWDVHHGNGTQDIFYPDPSVFFFSTHQYPWYPGTGRPDDTGEGAGNGSTLNCPFPAGSGREEILGAFRKNLLPAAREFKPDLVLLSAGFDSRLGDPLGRFTLSDEDFVDLTNLMLEIAATYAGGRLVSVLEGGYSLEGLASAAAAHVRALSAAG